MVATGRALGQDSACIVATFVFVNEISKTKSTVVVLVLRFACSRG